jgi:hypothetical protein
MMMRPEIVEGGRRYVIMTCFRQECGAVLAGVKAKRCGWPAAGLDPSAVGCRSETDCPYFIEKARYRTETRIR